MPTLATPLSFPLPNLWKEITSSRWGTFTQVNADILDQYLALSPTEFQSGISTIEAFIVSYLFIHSNALSTPNQRGLLPPSSPDDLRLKRVVIALLYRIIVETANPPEFSLSADFLSRMSLCFFGTKSLEIILDSAWAKEGDKLDTGLAQLLGSVIKPIERGDESRSLPKLAMITAYVVASSNAGKVALSGPDFLIALISSFPRMTPQLRYLTLLITHKGLVGLIAPPLRQFSLLADQLYLFKSKSPLDNSEARADSLLVSLISETTVIDDLDLSDVKASRAKRILDELLPYRVIKGAPQLQLDNQLVIPEQTLTDITQIQDLFPDLGPGFILALLEAYEGSMEQATAALLDGNLPPHIEGLDKSLSLEEARPATSNASDPTLVQQDDDYAYYSDTYEQPDVPAPRPMPSKGAQPADLFANGLSEDDIADRKALKSVILSRIFQLAQDDERDDTYDGSDYTAARLPNESNGVEDEDGTSLGSAIAPRPRPPVNSSIDIMLFETWKSNPEVFARTRDARDGKRRQGLRSVSKWSNDRIEDWAIMVSRDPKRQQSLENASSDLMRFKGNQPGVSGKKAWRDDGGDGDSGGQIHDSNMRLNTRPGNSDQRDSRPGASHGGPSTGGSSGRGGTEGGGRGRGGGRGDSSSNRGSRANHSRRDAHAKKMARGG